MVRYALAKFLAQPFSAVVFLAAFLSSANSTAAEEQASEAGHQWLARMANAARQLNYQGVFTYRYGNASESSRIMHIADALGELEKIELLEGPAREIIRNNDEVICYFPEAKTVKIDRAETRRFFPSLIPDSARSSIESYRVKVGATDRVAGRECQLLALIPKDALRYGYRLCADRETSLLLRASMMRGKDEVLEQFSFSEIHIGETIARERLKPSFEHSSWPVEKPRPSTDNRWLLQGLPAGFKKIMALERKLPKRPNFVTHFLLSDGLAAVSVFIEPRNAGQGEVFSKPIQQGPVSFVSKSLQDHLVTVLGEVPPMTVVQIANAVAVRP
jgi:sigma-E factor negative regulatory protein RseB